MALAKPKAFPPPLPPEPRLSRITPPPLPASALPVTAAMAPTIARRARNEDLPDFLDGAARRRRVLWVVFAVAGFALLAAAIATIASHYRPM